jgi:hypothetical protein
VTTAQKIEAIRDHLMSIDPDELPEHARDFGQNLQIARGLGFDPFDLLLPDDPNELDEMIDGAVGLLLELRGDDLPPFDFRRFMPDEPDAPAELDDGDRAELEGLA